MKREPLPWALAGLFVSVLISRFMFLTSSLNMCDSCAYVQNVRKMFEEGLPLLFHDLETGHPLYLQLCALVVRISWWFGGPEDVIWGMKATGILLTASSVWPFFWLARWLLRSDGGGLLATAFYCIAPLLWWWSGEVMSDAPGVVILMWAFGPLARWMQGRSMRNLLVACLVLGANPLLRFSNIGLYPLFLLVVIHGSRERRRLLPLLSLLLVPVPVIITALWELVLQPHHMIGHCFEMSGHNPMVEGQALTLVRWEEIGRQLLHSLSPAGLAAALLGLGASLFLRRGVFLFAALWIAPVLYPQVALPVTMIRYWLPLVPMAAILMAFLVLCLDRLPHGARISSATAALLAMMMTLHVLPDLKALHYRKNYVEALSGWYAGNTPPDALLIAGPEAFSLNTFLGDRDIHYYLTEDHQLAWFKDLTFTTPKTFYRIDEAIRTGRPVYVNDAMYPESKRELEKRYEYLKVGVLEGKYLRNIFDDGFVSMGEKMRKTRDVAVFQVFYNDVWPRPAPPPRVQVDSSSGEAHLVINVHCPREAGWVCFGLVSESPAALDWSRESFGKDPVLEAGSQSFIQAAAPLDEEGRGCYRVKIPRPGGKSPETVYAGYCILDSEGKPALYSVGVRIDL